MPKLHSSMRTSLGLTVLVMGVLGVGLAIVTGEIYRQLAFDNQRDAFETLVKLKVDDILDQVVKDTSELSVSLQSSQQFRQILTEKNSERIREQLNQQFHRFFVTLTLIKLEKLFVFDKSFQLLGFSSEGSQAIGPQSLPCPNILSNAKLRSGANRLRVISELCISNDKPFVAVIVPIGGIRLKGYLLTIVDPTHNLAATEQKLAMPLTLTLPNKQIVYKSDQWPPSTSMEKRLITKYVLSRPKYGPIFTFTFASDVDALYNKLETTRILVLLAAGIITLITALASLFLLQRTAIDPLAMLTRQLRLVREDKTHLGEKVTVTGNSEVSELAEDFNEMTSELHVLYKTLENMAFTDSLTGLPNRALFYDRLEQSTLQAKRSKHSFILLMLDLDRFKYVNDTLGHHIGDQLLKQVGTRLQRSVRKSDTIARLGGDEFAAILPSNSGPDSAVIIAEKILGVVNETINIENHSLTVGASIGIVRCPQDGTDNHQLMQRADVAMYHAKNNRYGFTFYENKLDHNNLIQLNLETELSEAIEKNQLELYFQPKISLNTGLTIGVEALIRWHHPEQGFMTSDAFISLAEQTGLVQPMTHWVLKTALKYCAQWHQADMKIGVSINVSARSLDDNQILHMVKSTLAESKVPPHWLSLELTESAVMADPDRAMDLLTQLHDIGLRISVDDFGTGYSSLAYLKKLPVSEIKIDKSFVMDMATDNNDAVIVHSTIDLAHNMGLNVTAEGVENKTVWNMLDKLGCDMAQGHYMCPPVSAREFYQWLHQSRWGLPVAATAL